MCSGAQGAEKIEINAEIKISNIKIAVMLANTIRSTNTQIGIVIIRCLLSYLVRQRLLADKVILGLSVSIYEDNDVIGQRSLPS